MTLTERLGEAVRACFPGLYVVTHEPDDATAELARLCLEQRWTLATWDAERGLALAGAPPNAPVPEAADPLAALRTLPALAQPGGTTLLVLRHLHRFLGSVEVVQAVEALVERGKRDRLFVVALAPLVLHHPNAIVALRTTAVLPFRSTTRRSLPQPSPRT